MRLNLGCGDNLISGYLNVDKYDPKADLISDIVDLDFEDNSVDEIVMYQVLEHTPWFQLDAVLANCYRMLRPAGTILIEVPDMNVIARAILDEGILPKWQDNIYGGYHRPQDRNRYPDWEFHAGSIHYQAFNFAKLQDHLEAAGFTDIHRNSMEEKHPDYHYEENLSVRATK